MSLGDRYPKFQDNVVISSSRVEISMDVVRIIMDFFKDETTMLCLNIKHQSLSDMAPYARE